MSISTRTGDDGATELMFSRRVPKTHVRIKACGAVDELNAALGLSRAATTSEPVKEHLHKIQQNLIEISGQLATADADLEKFRQSKFKRITQKDLARLDDLITELEKETIDTARLKEMTESLSLSLQKIGEAAYQAAGDAGQGMPGAEPEGDSGQSEDNGDVVEGEFEDV